jgi:hypothetical protein
MLAPVSKGLVSRWENPNVVQAGVPTAASVAASVSSTTIGALLQAHELFNWRPVDTTVPFTLNVVVSRSPQQS